MHHEIEVVVKINRIGKHIQEQFAHKYYQEIGLGIDFTARDLQQTLKSKGLPWEKAKAFDGATALGNWFDKSQFEDLNKLHFELRKNGQVVQKGTTAQMLWSIDALIAYVSQFSPLKLGTSCLRNPVRCWSRGRKRSTWKPFWKASPPCN